MRATRRHLSQVRAAPFILERSLLLLSLNRKGLSLCSKSDLWPYQCFLGGGHCSGATPPSNGQITALHMWDLNAPTSGLNHTKSTRSAISAAIHKESVSGSVTLLIVLYVLKLSDRRRFTPWASLLMWRAFNEELIWQRMIYSFKSSDSSRQLNSLSLFVGFVFLEW